MKTILTHCPVCDSPLAVSRLYCRRCHTAIEGRFESGPLAALTPEQLQFVETFIRCEGKFTRMEGELGLSYPTLRSRLHEVIRALGYEPGAEPLSQEDRRQVLARLEAGEITAEQAVTLLQGEELPTQETTGPSGDQ